MQQDLWVGETDESTYVSFPEVLGLSGLLG
jgi:hypothetical protein